MVVGDGELDGFTLHGLSIRFFCRAIVGVRQSARYPPSVPVTTRGRVASSGAPRSKLAAVVAGRIVDDVVKRRWPVGEVLGSEVELLERYGVSRAVFREAVRLVEHQHVARMRRGPGGGLVVTEPTVEAIIDAAVLYLYRLDARLDELFEARLVVEEMVAELAPQRLDEDDLVHLRELARAESAGEVRDHRALHALLAAATHNPALELFVDILNRVMERYFNDTKALTTPTLKASAHAHIRIAEAVVAGDEGLARRRMRRHLEAEADFLRRRRSTRQMLDQSVAIDGAPGSKRAEGIARSVFQHVVADGRRPGELLGSEAELMERYAVSRAVLREAVRLLEHHHVAAMRRGPGGGLFVVPPSVAAVSDVVALCLARRGLEASDLAEVRTRIELALVDLTIDAMSDDDMARLRAALLREGEASDEQFVDAGHDLHTVLAGLPGNRVLELVALVLVRLTRLHQVENLPARSRREIAREVHRAHAAIVEAVEARDRELARYRLRRHLDAVSSYLR